MLFDSFPFLCGFLPLTLAVYWILRLHRGSRAARLWLIAASLGFYFWGEKEHPLVIPALALLNFITGTFFCHPFSERSKRAVYVSTLLMNLAALGYFKYLGFFAGVSNAWLGTSFAPRSILWPLGLSFFVFAQIIFLADAYAGIIAKPYTFLEYCSYVFFFPVLISGPIAKHDEIILPLDSSEKPISSRDIAAGLNIAIVGLFKKTILAQIAALCASPVFSMASRGLGISAAAAWVGALAYTLQLYFDFSGYSDMAVGLGLLLGVRVPYNFNSPYKAANIIDFWQRWHITLTRFLTGYIYNPLLITISRWRLGRGLTTLRKGHVTAGAFVSMAVVPLMTTMFIAGFWHGAGWQYIVFGLLHGFYLTVNHAWNLVKRADRASPASALWARGLTFLAVCISLVFFGSADVASAVRILRAMCGLGIWTASKYYSDFLIRGALFVALLLGVVWLCPNSQHWLDDEPCRAKPDAVAMERLPSWLMWRPSKIWAAIMGLAAVLAIANVRPDAQFIYFKF